MRRLSKLDRQLDLESSSARQAAATFPKPSSTLIFAARRLADGLTTFCVNLLENVNLQRSLCLIVEGYVGRGSGINSIERQGERKV
jgi:hypothetical protein